MTDQQQHTFDCSPVTHGTQGVPCKVPLVDGENDTPYRLLTAEIEPENGADFEVLTSGDRRWLENLLCAAWGLLLRCYTGQESVSFEVRDSGERGLGADEATWESPGTVTIEADEAETLSIYIEKAKAALEERAQSISGPRQSTSSRIAATEARHINTTIQVIHPGGSFDPAPKGPDAKTVSRPRRHLRPESLTGLD